MNVLSFALGNREIRGTGLLCVCAYKEILI